MFRFAAGQFAVMLAVLAGRHGSLLTQNAGTSAPWFIPLDTEIVHERWEAATDLVLLGLEPPIFSLLIVALLNHRKPRRLFERKTCSAWRQFSIGIAAGILSLALAAFPLVYAERYGVPDWGVLCATAAIATFIMMLFVRRVQPGLCVRCGFDVRASLDAGRCPECGTSLASPDYEGSRSGASRDARDASVLPRSARQE